MTRPVRLAVVVSHPIQYYAPFYRALAQSGGVDLRVFFASRMGLDATFDPGMGVALAWKMDLLGGYEHTFLPEAAEITSSAFRALDNPSVTAALAAFAPDAVLIHGYTQMTMLRALAWCRRRRIPALMISDSSLHSATSLPKRLAKRALLPLVLGQFSAFLSIGDANRTYLTTFGVPAARIFRVPNMVDEGFWAIRRRRAAERARVRGTLGIAENELVVLFVGKLIPRKRPGDLLDALERLRSAGGQPIVALFAGDGALKGELERKAAEAGLPARFLGFVNVDALPSLYTAADALVHPAEVETFGVIVLEAAILGLPLVLSDRVGALGPTSIARPGENALVHRCGDPGALAAALDRLAREPDMRARLGTASLRISEEHDGRASVAGTLAALDHCLGGRTAPGALAARPSR